MLRRVAGGNDQKDTQGRVNGDDHLQILRPSARPGPTGGPEYGERIKAKNGDDRDEPENKFEVFEAFVVSHGTLTRTPRRNITLCASAFNALGFAVGPAVRRADQADVVGHLPTNRLSSCQLAATD